MDAEGVSTDPHEPSMPLKAMPKLVRLEGRSFPRNRSKEESYFQSKLKDGVDGSSKLYNDSEIQRKPYRRTHEDIEDFVAKRQRKPPLDRDHNPTKLFSYSNDKTDNSSIEKHSNNGYDLFHKRNGTSRYHNSESRQLSHLDEDGKGDIMGRRGRQDNANDLSRVNFIPGSSSSKSMSERAKYKYLQPYSSSIIVDGKSPSKDIQENNHTVAKDGNLKRRMLERSLMSMRREDDDRPPSKILNTLDHLQDKDNISEAISNSSRYEDFNHEKLSKEPFDSNVPLNLHKKVSNAQAGANVSTSTTSSTTLTMIRPNSSRKSSPASTVSSASSIALTDTLHEGNNGSNRSNLRSTDIELETDRDEYPAFHRTNDGKMSITDQNVINCLGRVSRNNDIIITSVPRSPSSSNSSSKEELDEYHKNNQHRRQLQSPHMSSNDKGLPQAQYSDSISASLISQMNSSPDNIARRGELMISPAPIEAGRVVDTSPTLSERESNSGSKPKYILALSPPLPTDDIFRGNQNEDDGFTNKYGSRQNTLSISSYMLDRRRGETSPPSRGIPQSLSDRLDSDCSRLLSSKRDLIVERVIQPDREGATEIDLSRSSVGDSIERRTNSNQKTDYNRFNDTDNRIGDDFSQSSTGSLRLKPFSKSLTGANVIQMPSASGISSLSFEQMNARKDNLFRNSNGLHERSELTNKMIGLSRLQMERFENQERFDPARPSSHILSNRPEKDPYLDILSRGKSFPANVRTVQDGQSKNNHLEDKTSGGNHAKIPCDYCDHTFDRESDLNDHIGRFHAGVKKYVCFVCHKRFKRKQSLENHVVMIHGVSSTSVATSGRNGSGMSSASASDGGTRNNGNSHLARIPEMPTREQMLMMMIEKGKANLAAGRRIENGED